MTATQPGDRAEYEQLLSQYHTAIFTTCGGDGHYHSRPMALQDERNGEELWFATSRETAKVHDLATDAQVSLAFHSGERDAAYLSISGTAEVVEDRATIHRMWSPGWKAWFPDGPDQEDLVLVCVRPEHVEWMKPAGGQLRVLYTMAKQALTGRRDQPDSKQELDIR